MNKIDLRNVTGIERTSDMSVRVCFTSARAASQFTREIESVPPVTAMAGDLVAAVDAAMVEMTNITPPLRRSECERLITAALAAYISGQEPEQTYSVWRGGQEGDYENVPASELTASERAEFKVPEVKP